MKILPSSIAQGNILVYKNELWKVVKKPTHTKPGKGPAYYQIELKNFKTGTKLNERLNASDYLEKAQLEQKKYQYLYAEGDNLVLMDTETFEQLYVDQKLADDRLLFLQDNMIIAMELYEDKPINMIFPATVIMEIVETSPNIKGSTVTSSYKPAVLESGVKVMVPPYLSTGEKIVVKIEDGTFVERAK